MHQAGKCLGLQGKGSVVPSSLACSKRGKYKLAKDHQQHEVLQLVWVTMLVMIQEPRQILLSASSISSLGAGRKKKVKLCFKQRDQQALVVSIFVCF